MKKPHILNIVLGLLVVALALKIATTDNGKAETKSGKEAIENIMQRKSVRTYKNKRVEEEKIDILLKAAMAAPSGKDLRPWQFIVIQDKEKLTALGEALPFAKMLKDVNQAIIVCGDSTMSSYWYLDCSAAAQNILLAAEALDLGAVWTAAYPYKDRMDVVRQNLQIPDSIQPLCVIPFGYPATAQKPKDKFNPKAIHRDSY